MDGSRNLAGASKGTPDDAKCVTEILGDKNKEVGWSKFKFGQLILRKIIKIVATRCHILRLKCTKFGKIGWGRKKGGVMLFGGMDALKSRPHGHF